MDFVVQSDTENDQLYIFLFKGGATTRGSIRKTIRVTDNVVLDFDKHDRLVGIDIINASRVLGAD